MFIQHKLTRMIRLLGALCGRRLFSTDVERIPREGGKIFACLFCFWASGSCALGGEGGERGRRWRRGGGGSRLEWGGGGVGWNGGGGEGGS